MKDDLKSDILNKKLEEDPTIAQNKMSELLKDADIDIKIKDMEDLFDFVNEPIEDPNEIEDGENKDTGNENSGNEDSENEDVENDNNTNDEKSDDQKDENKEDESKE